MKQINWRYFIGFILVFLFTSYPCYCQLLLSENAKIKSIDTLFTDAISIRALLVDNKKIWYAADKNRVGYYDIKKNKRREEVLYYKGILLEFRSIAQTNSSVFVLSISNPAVLFKINKKDFSSKIVYEETHPKVFYDSMQFWNDQEGIALCDPIDGCFSILRTFDGGRSWQKMDCDTSPKVIEGEAAFAASNTNIVIKNSTLFIVSGGIKSSVFVSEDKGLTWENYPTPIIQGSAMTGIFSADFYSEKIGFVVGGNYESPLDNSLNKAKTTDGGKTWNLCANNQAFGYASCVQYNPKQKGKELISVGTSGVFMSNNQGELWFNISKDTTLFTVKYISKKSWVAAGKNKIIRVILK